MMSSLKSIFKLSTNLLKIVHTCSFSSWLSVIIFLKVPIILVGNKCDRENEREVSSEEAAKFAREHHMGFFETCSWDGFHVREVFYDIIRYISFMLPQQKKKVFNWIKK